MSGGQKLLEELTQQSQNWLHSSEFTIESVECMSACSHACVIAFTSPGKFAYLFGDLNYDVDNLSATSTAVLECASLYCQKPDGNIPRSERPEALKRGIIARIPSYL